MILCLEISDFLNKIKKLLKNSKIGLIGCFVYIWCLLSLGFYDYLIHNTYPQNINPNEVVIPINPTMAEIYWMFSSLFMGGISFIVLLYIFYRPSKNLKSIFIWTLWLIKMLLIGTFIEQGTVLSLSIFFYLIGLRPLNYFNPNFKHDVWTSGLIKIHPNIIGILTINIVFVIILFLSGFMENFLRKRWNNLL